MIAHRIRCGFFLTCAALILFARPVSAAIQESAEPATHVPHQIILPRKIVSGAPATFAVVDANGELVPKVLVELSNGQKILTDATGRGAFNAPKNGGMMEAQITAQGITAFTFVLAPPAGPAKGAAQPDAVRILSYSRFVAKTNKFAIDGAGFRGDADTNRVLLGDQQCFVLASSPVSLVVFPGARVPIGNGNLSVAIAGKGSASVAVTVVQLEVSASADTTAVGAQATLSIRVRGATVALAVEIVNKSPDVVQFPHGAVQQLMTSGGESNVVQAAMKSLKPGDYIVTARLVTAVSGVPDLESARQELLAARLAATGKWPGRIDGALRRFDKEPPNAAKIRNDLAKMLRDMPPNQVAVLMDTAMQDLIRN